MLESPIEYQPGDIEAIRDQKVPDMQAASHIQRMVKTKFSFTYRSAAGLFRTFAATIAAASLFSLVVTGCTVAPRRLPGIAKSTVADDTEAVKAQDDHRYKEEVTIKATVLKLLPDDTQGLPHQRFLISLSNGSSLLIAHDTREAPRVPLQIGDAVRIHGEYIWNDRGGVIHWTHHSDTPRHEGGWIECAGKRYD